MNRKVESFKRIVFAKRTPVVTAVAGSLMIVHTVAEDSGLYVCHVTSQVLDRSVLSRPLELEVIGEL